MIYELHPKTCLTFNANFAFKYFNKLLILFLVNGLVTPKHDFQVRN